MFKKFCLLLLFVFIFFLVVLNLEGIYSYEAIEVDYALSNTDYNEIEERKNLYYLILSILVILIVIQTLKARILII